MDCGAQMTWLPIIFWYSARYAGSCDCSLGGLDFMATIKNGLE
jgi:hypothetical protein